MRSATEQANLCGWLIATERIGKKTCQVKLSDVDQRCDANRSSSECDQSARFLLILVI